MQLHKLFWIFTHAIVESPTLLDSFRAVNDPCPHDLLLTTSLMPHRNKLKLRCIAKAAEDKNILRKWQGDPTVLIDRFDVRAHLDFISPVKKKSVEPDSEDEKQELICDFERYRVLIINEFRDVSEKDYLRKIAEKEFWRIPKDEQLKCGCGSVMKAHSQLALSRFSVFTSNCQLDDTSPWSIATHTQTSPTDAYGTIVFQVWGLPPPPLVITVHGGMANFEVHEKLGRLFRDGVLKAAQTTGAWIITSGLDSGVVKQVAQALDDAGISARMRSKIVTIGIAPWGVIKRRERLVRLCFDRTVTP
ncbi:unnamed protein product [Angiostrongylus costaricensis]|uniref:DRY_EERY domain-containing protein n=1 Tax=Angiostrongylus costaricensis TaxID=334426 RepID=A0A0R3PIC3_ANGCS|nr:unnamed protein product [Angiostrongylus costaricensis]